MFHGHCKQTLLDEVSAKAQREELHILSAEETTKASAYGGDVGDYG